MTTRKDVRRLIKQTKHKDASLRALAALELGEIGTKYPIRALKNIVPSLRNILSDPDKDVKRSATEALADIRSAYQSEVEKKRQLQGGKFKTR